MYKGNKCADAKSQTAVVVILLPAIEHGCLLSVLTEMELENVVMLRRKSKKKKKVTFLSLNYSDFYSHFIILRLFHFSRFLCNLGISNWFVIMALPRRDGCVANSNVK